MQPLRRDGVDSAGSIADGERIKALIQGLQKGAWKSAGIVDRLHDPDFPYSGYFDPPEELANTIAKALMLSGNAVAMPIVTADVLTTAYQEKLSLPFIYAAWGRLQETGLLPKDIVIGERVFIASAPNAKLYPEIHVEKISKLFAIVFDANMLLFFWAFLASIARLTVRTRPNPNGKFMSHLRWGDNVDFHMGLSEIMEHVDVTKSLAQLVFRFLMDGIPHSDAAQLGTLEADVDQQAFVATMVDDLYVYLLAHELGHIHWDHFDGEKRDPTSRAAGAAGEEYEADIYAFSLLVNATPSGGGNMRSYIHISVFYHAMAYIYRAVHHIHFQNDYGALPRELMKRIYFPSADIYPHPLTRLLQFRREVRDKAQTVPSSIDAWDQKIDNFFENLWKPICIELMGNIQRDRHIPGIWDYIITHHKIAYEQYVNFK